MYTEKKRDLLGCTEVMAAQLFKCVCVCVLKDTHFHHRWTADYASSTWISTWFWQLTCNFWAHCETHNGNENISTRALLLAMGLRSAVNYLITHWTSGGLADENKGTPAKRLGRCGILGDPGSGEESPDSSAVLVQGLYPSACLFLSWTR